MTLASRQAPWWTPVTSRAQTFKVSMSGMKLTVWIRGRNPDRGGGVNCLSASELGDWTTSASIVFVCVPSIHGVCSMGSQDSRAIPTFFWRLRGVLPGIGGRVAKVVFVCLRQNLLAKSGTLGKQETRTGRGVDSYQYSPTSSLGCISPIRFADQKVPSLFHQPPPCDGSTSPGAHRQNYRQPPTF